MDDVIDLTQEPLKNNKSRQPRQTHGHHYSAASSSAQASSASFGLTQPSSQFPSATPATAAITAITSTTSSKSSKQQQAAEEKEEKEVKEPPRPPKIYFCSRTHSQLDQLVAELKTTHYRPVMSILGSRQQYCIHPEVSTSNNKNEDCKKLLDFNECRYFRQVNRVRIL